jgi:hypothetical protein
VSQRPRSTAPNIPLGQRNWRGQVRLHVSQFAKRRRGVDLIQALVELVAIQTASRVVITQRRRDALPIGV